MPNAGETQINSLARRKDESANDADKDKNKMLCAFPGLQREQCTGVLVGTDLCICGLLLRQHIQQRPSSEHLHSCALCIHTCALHASSIPLPHSPSKCPLPKSNWPSFPSQAATPSVFLFVLYFPSFWKMINQPTYTRLQTSQMQQLNSHFILCALKLLPGSKALTLATVVMS